jgi:tetratricopeptide (TPR) repeat protein
MSKLLEILGRAMSIDTAELIWHWLETVTVCDKSASTTQKEQIKSMIDFVAENRPEKAEELLNLYLFENPQCIRAKLASAAIKLQKNKLKNAVEQLEYVYKHQPSNTMALYALGHCCERLGKESEAVQFYQDCLKFKNHLQLPRQRLAAIYFKNGQVEKTTHEYELLKQEYPDDISGLVTLGHLYIAVGAFKKAVDTFNTAILIHPDSLASTDIDIRQLIAEGGFEQAEVQLDELIAENPARADLIALKADILAMVGETSEAVAKYELALRIQPDILETTIKLGTQYLQLGKIEQAAQQFNRAAEINDRIVDAYIGLAIAQKLNGEVSEALTTLSLASAVEANTPLLFTQTAILQLRNELSYTSSVAVEDDETELLKKVIEAHHIQIMQRPQNPDLYYRLGILFMNISDYANAVKTFQQTLYINPTYSRAQYKLAVCLFESGRQKEAMEQLKAPDYLDKSTLELHYKTGVLYCDKIRFASSLINLINSLEENYTQADPAVNISVVLQNLGLLDRASIMWENLIETAQFLSSF